MKLPLEKILTISLGDYLFANRIGQVTFPARYELKGVRVMKEVGRSELAQARGVFADKVPDGTEAVVGYREVISQDSQITTTYTVVMYGTAIIKKVEDKAI